LKVAFLTTRLSEIRGGGILLCNYAKALARHSRIDAVVYSIERPQADQTKLREVLDKDTMAKVRLIELPRSEKRENRFFRTMRFLESLAWDVKDVGLRDATYLWKLRRGEGKYLPSLTFFRNLLREHFEGYDVLHMGAWNTLYTFAASKMKSRLTYKTILHSIYHEAPSGTKGWQACRKILSNMDAITASTPWEERFFREHGLSKVYYVGESVDIEYIRTKTIKMPSEGDIFTVIFIGARDYGKGYYHALLAVNELAGKVGYSNIRMIVIGRGNLAVAPFTLRDKVLKAYATLKRHGCLEDHNFVSEDEKLRQIKSAHVVLLPSKAETIPLATLEAWALKKPSILGDIPTVRSVVGREGDGAVFVNFGDVFAMVQKLEEFYTHRDLLDSVGSKGHDTLLKTGSFKSVSARLVSAYEKVLTTAD